MPTLTSAPPEKKCDEVSAVRDFVFAGIVLGAVMVALTAMTWQKWPDLLVDFGVQLYVPWKLASGAVLYRDIAYLTGGPLSQYFNALVFKIFGASVLTLVFANLAVLALLLVVVYRSFYRAAGQATAVTAGVAILLAFAFEHYSDYGIFNYVTPYSEEIYHGLVLAILTVTLLSDWVSGLKTKTALAAGFCGGLVFLTKSEVFLALAVAGLSALAIAWRITGKVAAPTRGLGLMIAAGIVPPLLFLFYFLLHGTFRQSVAWTCWAWTPLFTTSAASDRFYHWCLGLDAPKMYMHQMFVQFAVLGVVLAVCAAVFRFCKGGWKAALAWVAMAALLAKPAWDFKWEECGHCLPLLSLTLLVVLLWRARVSEWKPATVFGVLWAVFSLFMLAKLGFNSRIWHYGFALAMPAFLAGIFLVLRVLPDLLEKVAVPQKWWRSFVAAFIGVALFQLTLGSKYTYQKKTVPFGRGADRLWTFDNKEDDTGVDMAQALDWMEANTPPNTTMAALPAGAMLNFALRRTNPSGYLRWNPPELEAFGQTNMTRAFEEHPPDYVLMLGVDNAEFGVRYFGDSPAFGKDLAKWIGAHYKQVQLIGEDWEKSSGWFGVKILQREPLK